MKKFLTIISMLLIASLALVACGGGDDNASNNNTSNTNTGGSTASSNVDPEKVFAANCSSCHGANLEGGAGPKLADVGSRLTKEEILNVIQNGKGFMGANIIVGDEADAVATWLSEKK